MDNNTRKKIEAKVKKTVDVEIAQEFIDLRSQLNHLQSSLMHLQQGQQYQQNQLQ